ncbi:MAG: PilN domain-containing protein, partial [Armatimonadetes bacterium]|nr:PilN domain-containing protein [Armatimonadota bacterium]
PQLYSELTHCFRFFQNQFPRRAVQRVIMAADHPEAESIASHLAEQLQLPVEPGRPGAELSLPSKTDDSTAALSRALTLALVRGAVLSASTDGGVFLPINLIPETTTFWKPAQPYIKVAGAVMLVLLAASLLWAWSLRNKITQQDRRLTSVTAEIDQLQPELEALRSVQATELALRSEVERQTARVARDRAVRWSQILVDIADRLPRDMWLTRVASPDSSRISLVGIATNEGTIPRALESLSGSPYLERVVLGSFTKDDAYSPGTNVYRYQINARLLRGLMPSPSGAEPASQARTGAGTEGNAR